MVLNLTETCVIKTTNLSLTLSNSNSNSISHKECHVADKLLDQPSALVASLQHYSQHQPCPWSPINKLRSWAQRVHYQGVIQVIHTLQYSPVVPRHLAPERVHENWCYEESETKYQQQTKHWNQCSNCCLSCSPKPIDLKEDQQLYNLDGPLDQQHFIVIKLQYKYLLHFSTTCRVFYKFILWRTTHFFHGPTVFLNYWSSGPGSNFAKGRTLTGTIATKFRLTSDWKVNNRCSGSIRIHTVWSLWDKKCGLRIGERKG